MKNPAKPAPGGGADLVLFAFAGLGQAPERINRKKEGDAIQEPRTPLVEGTESALRGSVSSATRKARATALNTLSAM